jgi:hypothetical protein
MATYRLTSWRINRFPATSTHAAYAHVTLHGKNVWGTKRFWERLTIPLPPDDSGDMKGNQRLVELAKQASSNKWVGRV